MKVMYLAGWVLGAALTLMFGSRIQTDGNEEAPSAKAYFYGADDVEVEMGLDAYDAVRSYYQKMNISIPEHRPPTVIITEAIPLDVLPRAGALGAFVKQTNCLYILDRSSKTLEGIKLFGQKLSDDIYYAVYIHEFAHFFNSCVRPSMGFVTDEYIASVVQFELMESAAKASMLKYASENYMQYPVSHSLYRRSMEEFMISSYVHSMQNPYHLEQCISDIDFFDMF